MNKVHSGLAEMERLSDISIERNESARLEEEKTSKIRNAIEQRAVSSEVVRLNDEAELEIYGSRGRTYIDPETNEKIADADNPIIGKLESIRTNRRFGTSEEEREKVAQKYESDLEKLQKKGYELCQAKLIMDLRESDESSKTKMLANKISTGMTISQAKKEVNKLYKQKDAKRLELIKEKGVFTEEDYSKVKAPKAASLYGIDLDEATRNYNAGKTKQEADEDNKQEEDVNDDLDTDEIRSPLRGALALPAANIEADASDESEEDGEVRIVDDEEDSGDENTNGVLITPLDVGLDNRDEASPASAENNSTESNENKSRRNKIVAAVVGLGVIAAAALGVLASQDGESERDEQVEDTQVEQTTDVTVADSVEPNSEADDSLLGAIDERAGVDTEDAEAPESDDTEQTDDTNETSQTDAGEDAVSEADAELIDEMVENISEDQLSVYSGLDASAIKVSGSVWPWENVTAAGAKNRDQVIVTTLGIYNSAYGTNFVLNYDNGMFIELDNGVTHIINPAELTQYNLLLKELAEEAN